MFLGLPATPPPVLGRHSGALPLGAGWDLSRSFGGHNSPHHGWHQDDTDAWPQPGMGWEVTLLPLCPHFTWALGPSRSVWPGLRAKGEAFLGMPAHPSGLSPFWSQGPAGHVFPKAPVIKESSLRFHYALEVMLKGVLWK